MFGEVNKVKEYKQLGAYGLIIKDEKILLIKKKVDLMMEN